MNFRRPLPDDEPEINLIPLIDVLLVILIFLAAASSFTRYTQMKITLPQAQAEAVDDTAIHIAISQEGIYALEGQILPAGPDDDIASALRAAAADRTEPVLTINADGQASHESVVRIMQAARLAGIGRVNFATQSRH